MLEPKTRCRSGLQDVPKYVFRWKALGKREIDPSGRDRYLHCTRNEANAQCVCLCCAKVRSLEPCFSHKHQEQIRNRGEPQPDLICSLNRGACPVGKQLKLLLDAILCNDVRYRVMAEVVVILQVFLPSY